MYEFGAIPWFFVRSAMDKLLKTVIISLPESIVS